MDQHDTPTAPPLSHEELRHLALIASRLGPSLRDWQLVGRLVAEHLRLREQLLTAAAQLPTDALRALPFSLPPLPASPGAADNHAANGVG